MVTPHTLKQEIGRLAQDHDTAPAVRRIVAQVPAMLEVVADLSREPCEHTGGVHANRGATCCYPCHADALLRAMGCA